MTAQTIIRPGGATLDIPVRGMTCASCVGRVERALRGVDGVEGATVNLATERARVSLAPGIPVARVAEAIRDTGYEPAEETVDLKISGMTCASGGWSARCARSRASSRPPSIWRPSAPRSAPWATSRPR